VSESDIKHKVKCGVCGHRFHIVKARGYQAAEAKGVMKILTDGTRTFDVTDFPSCGCQKAIGVRMAKCRPESEGVD